MPYSVIPLDDDSAPITREVLLDAWPWEVVQRYAREMLLKYPEAAMVIVADSGGNELWRCPEKHGA